MGLINKNMVSSLISKYAQVVLWFCRTGLLPEGSGRVSSDVSVVILCHYLPPLVSSEYKVYSIYFI